MVTPNPIELALEAVENVLKNQKLFATAEITGEYNRLFQLIDPSLKDLPPDQYNLLTMLKNALENDDRKTILKLGPDVLDLLKDTWQEASSKFYDAVKIYFKFIYENGRDPTPSECITLHLAPEQGSEYVAELQRLLQEGESSSLFEEEGDDEIKGQHYEDFVAREATNIAEKWHDQINRINIPTLVAEEGCSFADAIAIAHWLVDHGIAPDSALAIDVNPPPLQINHLEEAKFCPSCGHPLLAFQPGDKSVICEDCGYELKKGDRE